MTAQLSLPDRQVRTIDGEVGTVRAGESVVVDVPFPVQLRPAELAGPRRRG
jgi:hypothetical protein